MAKILIVDDQKSVLLTLEALLKKDGHTVIAAVNAWEAMRSLAAGPIDLVITDAVMPGGDGYSLIRTIRKQPTLSKLPVMLLTGKREKDDVNKGIECGADDYIVKPIDPQLLLAKVRNLLVSTPEETVKFAETPVAFKADIEIRVEIISASELGLKLMSNVPLPVGKILKIQSAFFDEVGIPKTPLRIDSCEDMAGNELSFKVKAHFVGMTEKELMPLRLWIRSRQVGR
ncbi:MAG: response regulator transcription factor [Bdellovibrio sp.]